MTDYIKDYIEGAGGGKDEPRAPVEAPNTLRSRSTIKVVEVVSEGEIVGLVGGLKGVYLDNTPVQNANGTFNFPAVKFDERTGTLDQEHMPGFPGAESAIVVNVELVTPAVRSVSTADVDAVRVTVRLPQGLSNMDTETGDLNGHRVGIGIDVRPANGTWVRVFTKTITGKSITPYDESYRVEKPNTATGLWEVRVSRISGRSSKANIADRVDWFTMTEIQDTKLSYPEAAVVGLAIDAESTGGAVPRRSYLIDGLIIKVPNNYTPTVYNEDGTVSTYASYSGVWNGTFKDSWCDDPAWILYDMLTNERYGMGEYIDTSNIDIYSFYEASKYNCELIDDGSGTDTLEPRFRCNAPVASREDAYKVLQSIAAMARCMIFSGPGYIKLIQDRPSAPVATLNNANVIDGQFSYIGTPLSSRITAVDVTYNDIRDRYLPATTTLEASPEHLATYGFNKVELTALGVVNEGQAIRLGKWVLDGALNTKEIVNFAVSWNNAFVEVGDVVNIADNFYAAEQFSGVIKAKTGTVNQIHLDRPVTVTSGQTIKFMTFEGVEHTRTITSTGTLSTLTLQSVVGSVNPSSFAGCPWTVLGSVAPRQFKITSVKEDSPGIYALTASEHDPYKYARVEDGVYVTPPNFTNITGWTVGAPQNVTVNPETFINKQGVVRYRLRLNWDDVDDVMLKCYRVQYRRNNGQFVWSPEILQSEYIIDDAMEGVYEYAVYAYNTRGVQSPPTDGYYDLYNTGTDPSPIDAPTALALGSGGTTFTGTSFSFKWTAPAVIPAATLKEYEVRFLTTADIEKKTILTKELALTVTRQDVINWFGTATRNIKVQVRARDTLDRFSLPVVTTFSNPAPAVPSPVNIAPFFNYYQVEHGLSPADVQGIRVHHSLTPAFTPSKSNLVKDDVGMVHLVEAETNTTYYVRLAAYDEWGTDELTYSGEYSVTTMSTDIGVTPNAPTDLVVTSALVESPAGDQSATITITWTKGANATQYDLEIIEGTKAAYYPTVSQPDSGTTVSYQLTGYPATLYKVKVRSRAANNVSVWSAQVFHTALADTTAPPAATGFTATAGYLSAALKWTRITSATDMAFMDVARTTTAGASDSIYAANVIAQVPDPLSTYFDNGLAAGTTYYYKIRGRDTSGNTGPWSAEATVTAAGLPANSVNVDQIVNGAITELELAANAVTAAKVATGAITTVKIADDAITAAKVATDAIQTVHINDSAITAALIAANAITTIKLAPNAITETKIGDDAISTRTIAAEAITANEIAALAITAEKIAANTITAGQIAANTITAAEIAAATITASQIAANTITAGQIAANAITASELAALSVQAGHITAGAIITDKLAANAVTAAKIAANTITAAEIDATSIRAAVLVADSIAAGHIAAGAVTTGKLAALAVTADKIAANTITAGQIAANTITASQIAANTITANEIAADAVTASEIAANTITAAEIAANTITSAQINAGSIRTAILTADSITSTHIATGAVTADSISTNQIITNAANIATGIIDTAHIATAAIENAKIANGAITNAKISGTIQSDNFVSGSAGWAIHKATGAAEFASITARGNITTGTGTATRVEVLANDPTYLLWAGTGTKTDANAVFYIKANGDAYFGGSLSAGVLRNASSSSTIGASSVETGPFGTNGGSKVVTFSLSYSNNFYTESNMGADGTITATIVLERSYNGGAWTQISSRSLTGTRDNVEYEPGMGTFYQYRISGSGTFTDNTAGTGDFNYRARVTASSGWPVARPEGGSNPWGNQNLTVSSTEE